MKETYTKPSMQIIALPEEELFTSSTLLGMGRRGTGDWDAFDYSSYGGPSVKSGSWSGNEGYFD